MSRAQTTPNTTEHTQASKARKNPLHRFAVVLLNDDYTPMDFVVFLLIDIFMLPHTQAAAIMMLVHEQGRGVCGVFQKDIAETKCQQVMDRAKEAGHPLQCVVEQV